MQKNIFLYLSNLRMNRPKLKENKFGKKLNRNKL